MIIELYTDSGTVESRYRKRGNNGEIFGDGYRDDTDARRGALDEIADTLLTYGQAIVVDPADGAVSVDPDALRQLVVFHRVE